MKEWVIILLFVCTCINAQNIVRPKVLAAEIHTEVSLPLAKGTYASVDMDFYADGSSEYVTDLSIRDTLLLPSGCYSLYQANRTVLHTRAKVSARRRYNLSSVENKERQEKWEALVNHKPHVHGISGEAIGHDVGTYISDSGDIKIPVSEIEEGCYILLNGRMAYPIRIGKK